MLRISFLCLFSLHCGANSNILTRPMQGYVPFDGLGIADEFDEEFARILTESSSGAFNPPSSPSQCILGICPPPLPPTSPSQCILGICPPPLPPPVASPLASPLASPPPIPSQCDDDLCPPPLAPPPPIPSQCYDEICSPIIPPPSPPSGDDSTVIIIAVVVSISVVLLLVLSYIGFLRYTKIQQNRMTPLSNVQVRGPSGRASSAPRTTRTNSIQMRDANVRPRLASRVSSI